jgi:CRISPR-associated protein (TIGR03986 family)
MDWFYIESLTPPGVEPPTLTVRKVVTTEPASPLTFVLHEAQVVEPFGSLPELHVDDLIDAAVEQIDDVLYLDSARLIGRAVGFQVKGNQERYVAVAGDLEYTADRLGLDNSELQSWSKGPFVLFNPDARQNFPGFWVDARTRQQQKLHNLEKAQQEKEQTLADRLRGAVNSPDTFVNPYTFVPFPENDPQTRQEPAGHDYLGTDRYSGSFTVTITVISPLMIRAEQPNNEPHPLPRRTRNGPNGATSTEIAIPGSSLKGAIRSLHESLAGGCCRVVDLDFVPVYREPVTVKPHAKLAVVSSVDADGTPLLFAVCEKVLHANIDDLMRVNNGPVQSGQQFDVNVSVPTTQARQQQRTTPEAVAAGTGWVALVTDSAARVTKHPYYVALGKLPATPGNAELANGVWERFEQAIAGSNDMRTTALNAASDERYTDVRYPPNGRIVGRRLFARKKFAVGDPVWVEVSNGAITKLSLSYIWRARGKGPVMDRIPHWAKPCRESSKLCISCRIFGSAETEEHDSDGPAQQQSYAAHVRFEDGLFTAPPTVETWELGPLAAPHLGAGQFSLVSPPGKHSASDNTELPSRSWGSKLDPQGAIRQLRGPKFYWQGRASASTRHAPPIGDGLGNMNSKAELIKDGAFTTRVTFDNLSLAELGGLIGAIQPSLALTPISHAHLVETNPRILGRLGGGKPFGFGTVDATVSSLVIANALSRYGGGEAPQHRIEDAVAAFKESVPSAVTEVWPALSAVLQSEFVRADKIRYPTLDGFFKNSTGQFYADPPRPMVMLPWPPQEPNQYLKGTGA